MKIVIIGRGNAGCISAMHLAYYRNFLNKKVEIELIYDSTILPVPTGQGTTLDFTEILFKTFQINYIKKFPTTIKTGIMYENWGNKNNKIFHPFPIGHYAVHFEPKEFQDFVCNNLKINFKETDENIKNYDLIDADYIIDCRGKPNDFSNYETLINPLNCALLANLPKKENDVSYTKAIAHKNGWCFYIPLPTTTSLGYIFNKDITSVEEAENDFKKTFEIEKINRVFPFKQYVAKSPIINNRVLLNGNKLFFLEPLEATAMSSYLQCTRFYYDYMFNGFKKETINKLIKDYITKIQDFILWHYSKGSIYQTPFWKYGKILWKKHEKENIQKIIKKIKKMSHEDISKSIQSNFNYAQWKEWNFKIWFDGIEKNIK
jgi:hypothetical protein